MELSRSMHTWTNGNEREGSEEHWTMKVEKWLGVAGRVTWNEGRELLDRAGRMKVIQSRTIPP